MLQIINDSCKKLQQYLQSCKMFSPSKTHQELQMILNQIDSSVIDTRDQGVMVRQELQRLKQQVKELQDDAKMKERLSKLLKGTNQSMENRQKMLTNKNKSCEERIKILQNQLVENKAIPFETFSELINQKVKEQSDLCKKQLESVEKIRKQKEETIKQLENKLIIFSEKKNQSSAKEFDNSKSKLKEKDSEIEQLKNVISKIKEEHQTEIQKLSNVKEDTSDKFASSSEIQALEKKNDQLIEQINSINKMVEDYKNQTITLQKKISKMEKEKESLNTKVDVLNRKIKDLQLKKSDENATNENMFDIPSSLSESSRRILKNQHFEINLDDDGFNDPMFISKKHEAVIKALERKMDEQPRYKTTFLNMIHSWAEFKLEDFCNNYDDIAFSD